MIIAAADPGVHGAIAFLDRNGGLLAVEDLPSVEVLIGKTKRHRVVSGLLADLLRTHAPDMLFIEQVHSHPFKRPGGEMVRPDNSQMMYSAGQIDGVAGALGIATTFVRPAVWKKAMQVSADKGLCRQRAMALWPAMAERFRRVKDADRAEAALVGLYGLRFLRERPTIESAAA